MELESCGFLHLTTTDLNVLQWVSPTNSVRKVSLHGFRKQVPSLTVWHHGLGRQVPPLTVLESFELLEELSIESNCFENHAGSLEALSLTLLLMSLKKVQVKVLNFDKTEIALLGCLFRSAPVLETMILTLPRCSQYTHEQSFLRQLLALKRPCESSVYIAEKHENYCKRCLIPS